MAAAASGHQGAGNAVAPAARCGGAHAQAPGTDAGTQDPARGPSTTPGTACPGCSTTWLSAPLVLLGAYMHLRTCMGPAKAVNMHCAMQDHARAGVAAEGVPGAGHGFAHDVPLARRNKTPAQRVCCLPDPLCVYASLQLAGGQLLLLCTLPLLHAVTQLTVCAQPWTCVLQQQLKTNMSCRAEQMYVHSTDSSGSCLGCGDDASVVLHGLLQLLALSQQLDLARTPLPAEQHLSSY